VTTTDWVLIGLALASVALLVLFVARWRVNAFLALTLAALLVGAGAVVMGLVPQGATAPLSMPDVLEGFGVGLGRTLGGVAAIIALGAMLGRLLAQSGGAAVLAQGFTALFGRERAVWCVMALAITVGLSTYFVVGLLLLAPILATLARETGRPFLTLAIPLLASLSVMHGLMPPHPGPVAALAAFHEWQPNAGRVLAWGFVIGLPTAFIAGPFFAARATRLLPAVPLPAPAGSRGERTHLPSFGVTLLSVLLPVVLMLFDTVARLWLAPEAGAARVASFVGNPTIALLVSTVFASWSLGIRCGDTRGQVLVATEDAVASVGMVLLVVGAGGGFAAVLRMAGVADAMGSLARALGLPVLLYGWLMTAFVRVATGSATVAIVAAAGLLAPVLGDYPGTNIELLIVAMGCGSLFLSLPNDGGFWVVKDTLGLSVGETLRTWTMTETLIGIVGLAITLSVHAAWRVLQ